MRHKRWKFKFRVGTLILSFLAVLLLWNLSTNAFEKYQYESQKELEQLKFENSIVAFDLQIHQEIAKQREYLASFRNAISVTDNFDEHTTVEDFQNMMEQSLEKEEQKVIVAGFVSDYKNIRYAYPAKYNDYIGKSIEDSFGTFEGGDGSYQMVSLYDGSIGMQFSEHVVLKNGWSGSITIIFDAGQVFDAISTFKSEEYNIGVDMFDTRFGKTDQEFSTELPVFESEILLGDFTFKVYGQLKEEYQESFKFLIRVIRMIILVLVLSIYFIVVFLLYSNNFLSGRVNQMVYYDSLTKLPNRRMLTKYLKTLAKKDEDFSVFFIDIYNFKVINDAKGHKAGDDVLKLVGEKFESYACPETSFFRWGGDEFIAVSNKHMIDASSDMRFILKDMKENLVDKQGIQYPLEFTAGGSTFKESEEDIDLVLLNADYAMQELRKDNRRGVQVYNDEIGRQIKRRIEIESLLLRAIDKKDFHVVFQPLVDGTGKVSSLEALVRWSLTDDKIFPDEFIPIAEQLNVIDALDLIVIDKALEGVKKIHNEGFDDVKVAVNVSITELNEEFIEAITEFMMRHDVTPNSLILEITERIDLAGEDYKLEILEKLRDAGVTIALDDFGSGFSSMMRLVNMPFDKIKIDKGLIDYCAMESSKKNIVSNVINMIHAMDMAAVAEGVETLEQVNALNEFGVDYIQGYYYSKPKNIDDVISYISERE